MRYPTGGELPTDLQEIQRKAVRLEWITIAYLVSAVVAIYFTLGSSQAMKGAWLEDMISIVPPIAFLFAARVRHKAPDAEHPYGHHRSVELSYLVAAIALLFMGFFLIFDSTLDLLSGEHPSIGMVELFDTQIWLGWLMLAALVWSAVPAMVLGRMKLKLAPPLHDKVLFADAKMNRADWMTAGAAMVGVTGIGLGLWWADSVAAIVIGIDIFHDGVRYTKGAMHDLLDGRPRRYDEEGTHPIGDEVRRTVIETSWVAEAAVRMRDTGHLFAVDVFVVPADEHDLVDRCEALRQDILAIDWKLQDVVVAPVRSIEEAPEAIMVRQAAGTW